MSKIYAWRLRLLDSVYTKQLDALFSWLRNKNTKKQGTVYVHLPTLMYNVDYNRRLAIDQAPIGILICTKETRDEAFQANERLGDHWQQTFSSPFLEIWEDPTLYTPESLPIRFGLNETETVLLHELAKKYLLATVHGEKVNDAVIDSLPRRLWDYTDIDVAFWVNGSLRGSIVYTDKPCVIGIQHAVSLASLDTRFKPLTACDLSETDIEISCISPLRIPLLEKEIAKNLIYPEKTYRTEVLGKPGWYLPTVFNCRPFKDLTELRHSLLIEKVGVSPETHHVTITISETSTSISSSKSEQPLTLSGPLVVAESIEKITLTQVQEQAITYLHAIQEQDGNIPAVINPLLGQLQSFDHVRLAHCTWALLEYGLSNNHLKSHETGLRSYTFITELLARPLYLSSLTTYERLLGLIYLFNAATLLEDRHTIDHITDIIQKQPLPLPDEPILRLQYIQFALHHRPLIDRATEETDSLLADFEVKIKHSNEVSLASYADLMVCLDTLHTLNGADSYREKLDTLINWFCAQQLENGAFPNTTHSPYCYTRGTLKILEALSSVNALTKLDRSPVPWISNLQYKIESTFSIHPVWQKKIIGGLRHDAHNATCWIDAPGHLLRIKNTL